MRKIIIRYGKLLNVEELEEDDSMYLENTSYIVVDLKNSCHKSDIEKVTE